MTLLESVLKQAADTGETTIHLPKDQFKALTIECLQTLKKWQDYDWPQTDHVILKGEPEIHVRIKR